MFPAAGGSLDSARSSGFLFCPAAAVVDRGGRAACQSVLRADWPAGLRCGAWCAPGALSRCPDRHEARQCRGTVERASSRRVSLEYRCSIYAFRVMRNKVGRGDPHWSGEAVPVERRWPWCHG